MFLFFKQKTAYEMRISDWSSDVCSSDLVEMADEKQSLATFAPLVDRDQMAGALRLGHRLPRHREAQRFELGAHHRPDLLDPFEVERAARSEEHTSELQSLMRISYAVFCLKKKNNKRNQEMQDKQ